MACSNHHVKRGFELLEPRLVLATVSFVEHEIPGWVTDPPWAVVAADFDKDQDADLVVYHEQLNEFNYYENEDGRGGFGTRTEILQLTIDEVVDIQAADLDGDGDLDILGRIAAPRRLFWLENQDASDRLWAVHDILPTDPISRTISMDLGDVDGDDDIDVVVVYTVDNNITIEPHMVWLENQDGAFVESERGLISTSIDSARSLALADMDNDADLDLVVGAGSRTHSGELPNARVFWIENMDGAGTFSDVQHEVTLDVAGQVSIATSDVDGDGDVDVISLSTEGRRVAWHENVGNGSGTFERHVVATTSLELTGDARIYGVDLDGDGDTDIVSNAWDIYWWEGYGDGTFAEAATVNQDLGAVPASHLSFADVDLDGDLEVFEMVDGFNREKAIWIETFKRPVGDVNNDWRFDSSDLVIVFQAGKYEDGIFRNASFEEGDWNGDGDFTSSDLVLAFQTGTYIRDAQMAAGDLAAAVDFLFAQDQPAARQGVYVA